MQGRGFSELSLRHHETRAGTVIYPAAIFRVAHVLPVSHRTKRVATRSGPRTAITEDRQETSARAHAAADRRIARRADEGRKKTGSANLDAAARCRDHGTFLQQRLALERTDGARCCRCRSLHRVGARPRQRPEGARLSGGFSRARSDLALSRGRQRAFRSAFHK